MSAPAASYTPPVDQPPPVANANPYGGFWVRLAAHFVDGLIIGIGTMVLAVALFLVLGKQAGEAVANLITLGMVVLGQLYHAYFVSSARMATPGKRLCGLYVTDTEGHRLGFGRALWRNVAAVFSYLTLYVGFIMAAFTERKQALHDKIAGTLVHRQPGGSAAVVIVIIVVVFLGIAIIGILAAIAIPAYQDYTVRAKVSGVISAMSAAKAPISEYAAQKGEWPTTWAQVESAGGSHPMKNVPESSRQFVEDIRIERGGAVVAAVNIRGNQGEIRMVPRQLGSTIEWTCSSSDRIRKHVPASCRE